MAKRAVRNGGGKALQRTGRVLLLAALAGCGAIELSQAEYEQILVVDRDGDSHGLSVDGEPRAQLRAHVRAVLERAADERHLLLYFHGGLVSSRRGAREAQRIVAKTNAEEVHLIAVNWETGFERSYGDYLLRVRGGRPAAASAFLTAPLYLVADLGRAAARLPLTYATQDWANLRERLGLYDWPTGQAWPAVAHLADAEVGWRWEPRDQVLSLVPGVLRLATTPLLDATGKGAYRNMRRRARVLFIREHDFQAFERAEDRAARRQADGPEVTPRTGAVELLMQGLLVRWEEAHAERSDDDAAARARKRIARDALERLQKAQAAYEAACERYPTHAPGAPRDLRLHRVPAAGCPLCASIAEAERARQAAVAAFADSAPFRITLIGHSMGAHVVNEIVRSFPELYYDEIVLMAPACSVQEFADTTLTFLQHNPETIARVLTLHPLAEIDDAYGWYTLPRGSLLEWIDGYVGHFDSPLDATLGKWINLVGALPVLADRVDAVRGRFFVKGFGLSGNGTPLDHGDFNDARFWDPEFWRLPNEP